MKTVPVLFLCLLFCAASFVVAQEADESGKPRAARGRVAWFVYTTMPEGVENPVSVMTGKDITELTLSKRSASQPVKIPADGIIRIVREVENPDAPEKPEYLILAQANVPEGVGKALIILVPLAEPKGDLVFQAKVQDLAKFTGGDWLYLNLTNVNIGVDMGDTKLLVKPGETKIYDAPSLTEATNMPIRYNYFHPVKQEWKMLSASTIVLRATRREICIFSIDPRFGRVNYHGITFPVTQ